jgi:hypothetical protein
MPDWPTPFMFDAMQPIKNYEAAHAKSSTGSALEKMLAPGATTEDRMGAVRGMASASPDNALVLMQQAETMDKNERARKAQELEDFAATVYSADTPEKFQRGLDYFNAERARMRQPPVTYRFEDRQQLIDHARGLKSIYEEKAADVKLQQLMAGSWRYGADGSLIPPTMVKAGPTYGPPTVVPGGGMSSTPPPVQGVPGAPAPAAAAPAPQQGGLSPTPKPVTPQKRSTVTEKEINEADDMVGAADDALRTMDRLETLNPRVLTGLGAETRAAVGSYFGDQASVDTEEFANLLGNMTLEKLRPAFGGNPTEGERKIMTDLQGSASQQPAVRARIFANARRALEARQARNREKAKALRSGEYYDENYPGAPAAAEVPTTGEAGSVGNENGTTENAGVPGGDLKEAPLTENVPDGNYTLDATRARMTGKPVGTPYRMQDDHMIFDQ